MTSIRQRKEIQKYVFRRSHKSRNAQKGSRVVIGLSSAQETKSNFKETGHPVFRDISASNYGILKRRGGRCTVYFDADSSNTELLIRTIHSANQLSIYGAVSSWCEESAQRIPSQNELTVEKTVAKENEQLLKNVKQQEVNSMVQTPRSNDGPSGNRLREQLQRFETLGERNPIYESL